MPTPTSPTAPTSSASARSTGPATPESPTVTSGTSTTRPPATTIGQRPDKSTTAKRAEFGFDANEPVDRYECRRDEQADWHACTSPHEYTDLGLGGHTFRVRAVDRAGNVGAADAYDWTIVAPPPTCAATTVTVEANADSWILQSSAAKNYGNESNAKVTTKSERQRPRRGPLPAPGHAGRLRRDRRQAAPLRQLVEDRPDARGHPPRERLEGERDHLAQPARHGRATPPRRPRARTGSSGPSPAQTNKLYNDGNHGFLVRDKVESNGGAEQVFNTRERQNNRPRLVITFGPPAN